MSVVVFPFRKVRPWRYGAMHETFVARANGGRRFVRAELGAYGLYRVSFGVRVPGDGETNETLQAFIRARQGAYDTFLFHDDMTALYGTVTGEVPAGTVNGVNTVFTLAKKHVDASSLVVRRNGSVTAAYVLSLNNSTPTITYTTAPTSSVGADYEFFMPVRFEGDPEQGEWLGGTANYGIRLMEVVEEFEGAHLVSP